MPLGDENWPYLNLLAATDQPGDLHPALGLTTSVGAEESSRELGLLSLEKKKLQRDLIVVCQYQKGACKKDGDKPFRRACWQRTRGDGFKLKEG